MIPSFDIIEFTYNTKLPKRRVSLWKPIISFLFSYNQYLLKQIDQLLLEFFNPCLEIQRIILCNDRLRHMCAPLYLFNNNHRNILRYQQLQPIKTIVSLL